MPIYVDIKKLDCKWLDAVGDCSKVNIANLIFDIICIEDFRFMLSQGFILLDNCENEICNFYDLLKFK